MSLETELKKLNDTITALTAELAKLEDTIGDWGTVPSPATQDAPTPETESSEDSADLAEPGPALEARPVNRAELGQWLRELSLKYGKPAQDAIKEIVLARGGTQALSKVPDSKLPVIRDDVQQWVDEQENAS